MDLDSNTLAGYYGLNDQQAPAGNALSGNPINNPISFPSLDAPLGGSTRSRGQKLMGVGGGADLSTKLGALGAMFTNKVPEFRQQMMQEREAESMLGVQELQKREMLDKSLAKDYFTAFAMAENGDYQGFMDLMEDRLRNERKLGLDTSSTLEIMQDAQGPDGLASVMPYLKSTIDASFAAGYLTPASVLQNVPASYRALEMQADAAGLPVGSQERREFMLYGGADSQMGASKTISFGNGVFIEKPRIGPQKVYDRTGALVTDPDEIKTVLDEANKFGIVEAGLMAQSSARGTATEGRYQEVLETGIRAARNIRKLEDAIEILGAVETGGIAALGIKLRRKLGITSADEGRLAYILRKNVLQQLKPTFGAAFTAREGEMLTEIEANETQSTASNIALLEDLLAYSRLDIDRAKLRGRQMGESGELAIQDMDGYLQQNFYPLDDLNTLDEDPNLTGLPSDLPIITSQEEWDNLPTDTEYRTIDPNTQEYIIGIKE